MICRRRSFGESSLKCSIEERSKLSSRGGSSLSMIMYRGSFGVAATASALRLSSGLSKHMALVKILCLCERDT